MTHKPVKKFSEKDLTAVLVAINTGRGEVWKVRTLRELVMYIRWLHGRESTNGVD